MRMRTLEKTWARIIRHWAAGKLETVPLAQGQCSHLGRREGTRGGPRAGGSELAGESGSGQMAQSDYYRKVISIGGNVPPGQTFLWRGTGTYVLEDKIKF